MFFDNFIIKRILYCIILLITTTHLTSCGRKSPPVPPGTLVPQKISDLSYRCTEKGVELTWSVPQKNNDGSPVYWIDSFLIYKAYLPPNDACRDCPIKFDEPIEIPFNMNPEQKKKMFYEDRVVNKDNILVYEVVSSKGYFGKSDRSNRVKISWHPPPSPPTNLSIKKHEKEIILQWDFPKKWSDGTEIKTHLFYNVYALDYNNEWKNVGIVKDNNKFIHTEPLKGVPKKYRISAVTNFRGTIIESEPSQVVYLTESDNIPPLSPKGLVATFEKDRVELLWQENSEEDLRGYFIFRVNPDGLIDKLNEVPVPIPRWTDKNIPNEGTYQYYVIAVDNASPPNESKPSNRVKIQVYK